MRIFKHANYNFIRWRWHALIASVVIIWAGVGTIFLRGGIPMGIEFRGGAAVVVQFAKPVTDDEVRRAVEPVSREVQVQDYKGSVPNQVLIRIPMAEGAAESQMLDSGATQIEDALKAANLGAISPPVSADVIGPSVGSDLRTKGIWATVAALGGILVYVAFRFRPAFAVGAVVAAFHDILITLVFLTWFHYDLTLNIIAALLTITGYSVNDTIVVFDRVRENQKAMRRVPLDQIVNTSVNQTLGRTVITSSATLLAVLALYTLGGEVLRGFAFTMIIGVITGTYSTVFIAAAIAIILTRRSSGPTQAPAVQPKTPVGPAKAPVPAAKARRVSA
ncbi:MAG TPA: protein translocase subunit SecF [Vicinamibacterales bacterium]